MCRPPELKLNTSPRSVEHNIIIQHIKPKYYFFLHALTHFYAFLPAQAPLLCSYLCNYHFPFLRSFRHQGVGLNVLHLFQEWIVDSCLNMPRGSLSVRTERCDAIRACNNNLDSLAGSSFQSLHMHICLLRQSLHFQVELNSTSSHSFHRLIFLVSYLLNCVCFWQIFFHNNCNFRSKDQLTIG